MKSHKGLLFLSIVFIIGICVTIGYAMLDKLGDGVYNNSTGDIKFNNWNLNIEVKNTDTNNSTSDISIDKTNIKTSGSLESTDSEIKYDLAIKNKGSITAYLYSIINSNSDIDISLVSGDEELKTGVILKPGEEMEINLIIKNKGDAKIDFENNTKLVFNQYVKED